MNSKKAIITGRALTTLISLQFGFSGVMKLFYKSFYPQMPQELARIGLPENLMFGLGVLELACVIAYAIPQTAVLGAVLMTGYIGGAMLTHLRIGEPVYMHIFLGIVMWLGIYLREPRLHSLMPIRKK